MRFELFSTPRKGSMVAGALNTADQQWGDSEQDRSHLPRLEVGDCSERQDDDETAEARETVQSCVASMAFRAPPSTLFDAQDGGLVRRDCRSVNPIVVTKRFAAIAEREVVDDALLHGSATEDGVPYIAPGWTLPESEVELLLNHHGGSPVVLVVA